MGEHGLGQYDTALLQSLALRFMDRHSPRQANWKLSASKYKRKLGRAAAEGDARKKVSLSLGAPCENPHVEKPLAHFQHKAANAIADALVFVEVPQDYHHSSHAQTQLMRRQA